MEQKQKKFYTGQGDRGLTALTPGAQVSKADERIAAPGEVEELVAVLGTVKVVTPCPIFRGTLERIQRTLRTMREGLRDPRSGKFIFSTEEITFLEADMDHMLAKLPEAELATALPGGCEQSARLDLAHTICRRAERAVVAMDRRYSAPAVFKTYLNRLSDYLLVAARYADVLHEKTVEETAAPASVAPVLAPVPATALTPPAEKEALVAEVLARLGGPRVLDLTRAKAIIAAVEARAAEEGKHAVIAVAGPEGNPIAVHVMDGAFLVSYEVAVKKAYTAVAVKMSTLELSTLCQPGGTFYGLQALDKLITFGGGVPLVSDGVIVGSIGVSGSTGEEDHALALYGAAVFAAE